MRRVALTLGLALLSLAFAPAPFPKTDRLTPRQREMLECERQLEALGITWRLEQRGEDLIVVFVAGPGRLCNECRADDEDLAVTLRRVARFVVRVRELQRRGESP
jgi:hypothetical protein